MCGSMDEGVIKDPYMTVVESDRQPRPVPFRKGPLADADTPHPVDAYAKAEDTTI